METTTPREADFVGGAGGGGGLSANLPGSEVQEVAEQSPGRSVPWTAPDARALDAGQELRLEIATAAGAAVLDGLTALDQLAEEIIPPEDRAESSKNRS